ncbi:MAG TPA: hypothetical protein VGX28_12640 [Frankiaceae bacterium]|nr:hypothetical protein [Frankiaceae bacterium]
MTPAPTRLLAWVANLDEADRAAFYEDLAGCVRAARDADDPGEIESCLRQWRLTAEGMSNAGLRDQLLE